MSVLFLRVLVTIARVIGLLPLQINFVPLYAAPSQLGYVQSIICMIIFGPLTIISMGTMLWLKFWTMDDVESSSTVIFTLSLSWGDIIRSGCQYVGQLKCRHSLVALINEAVRIHAMFGVSYGALYAGAPFLDSKCKQLVNWKIFASSLQFGIMATALYDYDIGTYAGVPVRALVKVMLLIFTDMALLVYTAGHFALMLVTLQFFRSVNARLADSVAVVKELLLTRNQTDVKVRLHSNITEDIERIAFLYDQVSAFAHRLNDLCGFPVVVSLTVSFLNNLVAVS